jgi:hypothetical protein
MNKIRVNSISDAVKIVIDEYPAGYQFYGNEFKNDCVKLFPKSKDSYVDTFLKMARRHRRASYISIDRNNSLYEKVKVESFIEQIKKVIPEPKHIVRSKTAIQQLNLPLFSHVFLIAFFGLLLGVFFCLESGYGRPLFPPSLITSKSSSVYIPAEPIYLNGSLPLRLSRILTADDEVLNRCAMSNTVIPSIPSFYSKKDTNQVVNAKKLQHSNILLYGRIVKLAKFSYFCEISLKKLDNTLRLVLLY